MPRRTTLLVTLLLVATTALASALEEARRLTSDGNDSAALEQVRAALEQNPTDASARLLEGVILSRLGRVDEAIARFQDLSRDRPELPEAYNNLAVLFAARGDYEGAREALVQAVRLQPDYDVAHENLGDIYTQLAEQEYRVAAATNEANTRAGRKALAAQDILDELRVRPPAAAPPPTPAASLAQQAPSGVAPACVVIGELASRARAEEVERWLEERGITGAFERIGVAASGSTHQVYVAPAESLAAARAAEKALRASGVKDLMVITSGPLANGISLGVFSDRSNAERYRQHLTARGVEALIADGQGGGARYIVRTRAGDIAPQASAIGEAFPEASVTAAPCS